MAITDINISEKLEAGAPSIKYTGNMDPNMEPNMQVASDPSWEAEWEDAYQNYKAKQIELGQEFVDKETFMDQYQNNMASGGRAHFGLGSIIKKITKPIKKLAKSPIGKAALLGGLGMWGMGAGPFSGGKLGGGFLSGMKPWLFGSPAMGGTHPILDPGKYATKGILSNIIPSSTMGRAALVGGLGLTAASAFEGMEAEDVTALKNNPEALRSHLEQYYRNVNSEALKNKTMTDEDVTTWVESQMYSTGGRVGLRDGTDEMTISTSQRDPRNMTTVEIIKIIKGGRSTPEMFKELMLRGIDGVKLLDLTEFEKGKKGDVAYSFDERLVDEYDPKTGTADESFLFKMRESNPDLYGKYTRPREFYGLAEPTLMYKAKGGRIGFAYGPDQTAQAAGIMEGLPTRNNAAGVKELDLRDSGGFIPPVGIKEKADDIPAMLSNNEFVFTADAVRAAGGGSVEKGAQVMYDTMKNLENKVV